ncbi:MAG: class I SAM-dependent methyltransferase [Planctomycetota bacterium]
MDPLRLLIDLHADGDRQGPGAAEETLRAASLAGLDGLDGGRALRIADLGCGTGAASLALAGALGARITAVDLFPAFLDELRRRARERGLADRIDPVAASMDALPLREGAWDAVWSEGAIYNIGFEAGIARWKRLLRPGGILAVTELSWLTAVRPAAIEAHWRAEYPEVDTVEAKRAVLVRHGYQPVATFVLPAACWTAHYYAPMRARWPAFLERHGHSDAARAIVDAEREEIALYEAYSEHYGYAFYIARVC